MKRTKDFETRITHEFAQAILEHATRHEFDMDVNEGSLIDSYVIYANSRIKIHHWKPREFILLVETYRNAWISDYLLVLTDKIETVEQYLPDLAQELAFS